MKQNPTVVYYMPGLIPFIEKKEKHPWKSMSLKFCYVRYVLNATPASGQLAHVPA